MRARYWTFMCHQKYVRTSQNNITEEEQRWGSKTVEGSGGRAGAVRYVYIYTYVPACTYL